MIEYLRKKIEKLDSKEAQFNALREQLQLIILKTLDEQGFFRNLAFVGGTALRILYDLNRFSEDLDFCLVNRKNYTFSKVMHQLEHQLKISNLDVSVRFKDKKTVAAGFIKFNSLLYEFDLSRHADKVLSIKFEVDQNPPQGYELDFSMVSKDYLIGINHFDLPSLFAGKLHAILCRKYTKGRDYYDLIWYLGQKITLNYALLNQSILQTEGPSDVITHETIASILSDRIKKTDFIRVKNDVLPFLVDINELRFFDTDTFLRLVQKWSA